MRWALVPLLLLSFGCVSQSSLDALQLATSARSEGATFRVEHQAADERRLDRQIAGELRRRGFQVVEDPNASVDYRVTYIDRWYWDMRMYLIDLRIDVRDAESGVLVGTGRSYQSSLAAMGQTHTDIIQKTVGVLIDGVAEKPPRESRSRSRRR